MTIRGGPPLSNTRTCLPQIKSKFDLEPNPFEQSFKDNPNGPDPTIPPIISNSAQNTNSPSLNHLLNATSINSLSDSNHFNLNSHSNTPFIRPSPGPSVLKVQLPGINSITSPRPIIQPPISPFSWAFAPISSIHSDQKQHPPTHTTTTPTTTTTTTTTTQHPSSSAPHPQPSLPSTSHSGLTPLIEIQIPNSISSPAFTPATQALIALFSSENNPQIPPSSSSHLPLPSSAPIPSTTNKLLHLPKLLPVSLPLSASHPDPIPIQTDSKPILLASPPSSSLIPSASLPFDIPPILQKSNLLSNSPPKSHINPPPPPSRPRPYLLDSALPQSQKPPLSHPRPLASSLGFPHPPPSSPPSPVLKLDSASSSSANPLEPLSAPTLHSLSPVGLPTAPSSFPCSATPSRSSLTQLTPLSTMALPATLTSSPHSSSAPALLPPNPQAGLDEHYNTNPLYLLTVAHEASSRLSQINSHPHHHDTVDDATVTAAAALTGLGSSGGSRYSSPGPNSVPNGSNSAHQHLASHVAQSLAIKPPGVASTGSSPTLSAPRTIIGTSSGPALAASLICRAGITAPSADERPRFGSGTYSGTFASAGPSVGEGTSSGNQSGGGSGTSSGKRKGKRRKELGDDEACDGTEPDPLAEGLAKGAGRTKGPAGESSPLTSAGRMGCPSSSSSKGQQQRTAGKLKKGKKAKMDEGSGGDESDGREPFWGMEDEMNMDEGGGGNGNGNGGAEGTAGSQGRPETEEEKRKNFLERNRQAALKCRQRKKAWLANLQSKVEYLSTENESLQETISRLQEEIESIRSILVSHQDCPINVNVGVGVGGNSSCNGQGASGQGGGKSRTIGELVGSGGESVGACVGGILVQQQQGVRNGAGMVGQSQSQTRSSVVLGQSGSHQIVHSTGSAGTRVGSNGISSGSGSGSTGNQHMSQHIVGQHHLVSQHQNHPQQNQLGSSVVQTHPISNPVQSSHQHHHHHQAHLTGLHHHHLHAHNLHHQTGLLQQGGGGNSHSNNNNATTSTAGGAGAGAGTGTGHGGSSGGVANTCTSNFGY